MSFSAKTVPKFVMPEVPVTIQSVTRSYSHQCINRITGLPLTAYTPGKQVINCQLRLNNYALISDISVFSAEHSSGDALLINTTYLGGGVIVLLTQVFMH